MNEEETSKDEVNLPPVVSDDNDSIVDEGEELKDKLKKLREKLKQTEAEKLEYLTGWQRAKADYINQRREHEESRRNFIAHADEAFFEDLIPVLDSFSMAFANKEAWEKTPKEWRTGVEYIHTQLLKALENHHITEFVPKRGDMFDATIHESVGVIEIETKTLDNAVVEVVKNGYKLKDKVLRPAQVKIGQRDA